jgi:hypothetical protein
MRFATHLVACLLLALQPLAALAASVEEAVVELQHEWEIIKYRTPEKEQEKKFEALAAKAHQASQAFPDRAEPLVWEGIIVSSWAGATVGFGALGLAKRA